MFYHPWTCSFFTYNLYFVCILHGENKKRNLDDKQKWWRMYKLFFFFLVLYRHITSWHCISQLRWVRNSMFTDFMLLWTLSDDIYVILMYFSFLGFSTSHTYILWFWFLLSYVRCTYYYFYLADVTMNDVVILVRRW